MFSKIFINRPILATVLALIFIVAGLLALDRLPTTQYPNITPPTVMVTAIYPGASAQTIAQTVGIPIEQQVNGVDGMLYMSSNSSSSGVYSLIITFAVGTDIDMATVMVENRVNSIQSMLPEAVVVQGVTTQKQSTNVVMYITIDSKNKEYDGLYLSNYAELNLVNQLTRTPGVGNIMVMGAGEYSMRIWLNPSTMRIRGISPDMVYNAISTQNMAVSAGYVGQPLGESNNPFQYTLTTKGQLVSTEEFGNIILRTTPEGEILRLKDIAVIEEGSASYSTVTTRDGEKSAAIAIYQLPGSNSLEVAVGVKAKMKELATSFPDGVEYHITLDTTEVINASVSEVLVTFVITTLLVILVIMLFLQNFWSVLIPCLTIPVSLIGTLAVMDLLGFSINTLTLFGLILSIAIVVDDAIVVVENSYRHITGDKVSAKEAITNSMKDITSPIVGTVLVMLAVFIPTGFISGISGQLYKQFALTIAASALISGFNSLTFTPALCAIFLKAPKPSKFFLFKWFNKAFEKTAALYLFLVKKMIRYWVISILIFIAIATTAVVFYMRYPTTFLPAEDDGYFIAVAQLPPAASLSRTEAVGVKIDEILKQYPEVKSYIGISGFSIMGGGEESNTATYFVVLKNWDQRKGKDHTAQAVVNRFNESSFAIEEASIFAMVPPAIPGLGAFGGLQLQLEDRNNLGPAAMENAVNALVANFHKKPALIDVTSMYEAAVPQYNLLIDRDKVALMGLQLNEVFNTLSLYMGPAYVNDYNMFNRVYQVKIEANAASQKLVDNVLQLSVTNNNGKMVPFSSFTTIKEQLGMDQIERYNMYNTAALNCIVMPTYSSGEGIAAMESLIKEELGDNYGYEWTSVAYQETQSSSSTSLIFLMALLVAFLVLAAQYESWTNPIAVILGLPIALLGTMIGCFLLKIPVSIYTMIGLILLIALSAKNAILIVEFARDYHAQGNSIEESAIEGGRVRLRPILMTSFAFVLGVMPLIFATGAGAQSRIALGTAVVFGMAMNALVATLFVPLFYTIMQKLQEKVSKKKLIEN